MFSILFMRLHVHRSRQQRQGVRDYTAAESPYMKGP